MTKFKVGDKVRILDADKIFSPSVELNNGDIFVITGNEGGYGYYQSKSVLNGKYLGINPRDLAYIEKVSDKPTKNQRISTLESEVAELKAEVAALKADFDIGKSAQRIVELVEKQTQKPSANEQRKAIIAEAKAFVEDVKEEFHGNQRYIVKSYVCDAEFIVNKEKRAVTALLFHHSPAMKDHGLPRELKAKGIAKCAPDDVFNADIGKAIALGRALGLDVSKFEQAVKPTEVVAGMRVQSIERHTNRVRFTHTVMMAENKASITRALTGDDGYSYAKIIDDTEADY